MIPAEANVETVTLHDAMLYSRAPEAFWVSAEKEDAPFLESLGIKLGEYDEEARHFRHCTMPGIEAAFMDEKLGARHFYGLELPVIPAVCRTQVAKETFDSVAVESIEPFPLPPAQDFFPAA